jgi:signal peptidase II
METPTLSESSPASTSAFRLHVYLRLGLFALTLAADQITKLWARITFSLPNGEPDYYLVQSVIGEWLQFRLVYNHGAAFGMKPQALVPFLHPTVFFGLFSAIAIGVLVYYYMRLQPHENGLKTGVALILSGAVGNLIDRLTMHKVTDFIDVGIPGLHPRWPTFNIADSCVCIGVGILLILPMLLARRPEEAETPDHA